MRQPLSRDPDGPATKRRRSLGTAIRAHRGDLSQAEVGRRLDQFLPAGVRQATLSRWEAGEVEVSLEQVRALELVLGLRLGTLAAEAGYT